VPVWYPIESLLPELEVLVGEIASRNYSFQAELNEVTQMRYALQEAPENSVHEFNELYARVQSLSSRVAEIIIQVYREKAWWQHHGYTAKKLYRKARTLYLQADDVRKLKNKELQEAYVHEQVSELVDVKELIEDAIDSLDLLIDTFQIRKDDLDKANVNLSRQQKVVESLIGLGHPVQSHRESDQE
jgi:uncharacterized protein YaaN involved in tellurite resistance